jgi:beta-glucosidase-like glycosyl hydrolase
VEEDDDLINSDENIKVAYQASLESVVLLKNENNILPLYADGEKTLQ